MACMTNGEPFRVQGGRRVFLSGGPKSSSKGVACHGYTLPSMASVENRSGRIRRVPDVGSKRVLWRFTFCVILCLST